MIMFKFFLNNLLRSILRGCFFNGKIYERQNRNTVEFLAVWEELHNPDFNRVQFEAVRKETILWETQSKKMLFMQKA